MKYLIWIAVIFGTLFMAVPGGIILWMGLRSVWHETPGSPLTPVPRKGVKEKATYIR